MVVWGTADCSLCSSFSSSFAIGPFQYPSYRHYNGNLTVPAVTASLPSAVQARISVAASTGRLDLSHCGLDEVPAQVYSLADLVDLSLAGNNITHIEEEIQRLKSVRRLGLSGNWLSKLPASIGKLQQLEGLWVQGNLLQSVPEEIGNLEKLSVCALTGNMLHAIPDSICCLSKLQVLSLSGNKLKDLPSDIGNLAALRVLGLNGNLLHSLPAGIATLSSLEELSLQGNHVISLPENLSALGSLKHLSMGDNFLPRLPMSIGELDSLESLSVYGNRLTQLPISMCDLKQLRSVWLEGNLLNGLHLLECFSSSSNLKSIGVDHKVDHSDRLMQKFGKTLKVSRIVGTERAALLGGYFKLQQEESAANQTQANVVVVAFGSAPGVPNWGGLLRRARMAMSRPDFDILYVVDSRRSWYTENKLGQMEEQTCEQWKDYFTPDGPFYNMSTRMPGDGKLSSYYYEELKEALKDYKQVIMLGDSMGASAALLFSPLATSVIAFCPQVDLASASIRPGRDRCWLQAYKEELLEAVKKSSAHITVHCGSWEHDLSQAKLLPDSKVNLVVHHNDSHRLAKALDLEGSLLALLKSKLEEEIDVTSSSLLC